MKYTTIQTVNKLLLKNYVKLTLQCRSSCSHVKEDLKLVRKLKSVSCGDRS